MGCRNSRSSKTDNSIVKPAAVKPHPVKNDPKPAEPTKVKTKPTEEDSDLKHNHHKQKEEVKVTHEEKEIRLVAEK